ncbi:hypothetical protein [Methanoregula formicica]|uniref:Uncharacterized protein n=1 Tax=Methanoregula formicica (strain DSM 22288 / NBRC 105244 / SMSP) TaxID=593750 RepID=L0HEG7_METFS|nr:hypothetical protein [Methanoregula formicica]AGB02420.1 hypothetical protein Metfor_1381 [Methanoregula formicica SMSP]
MSGSASRRAEVLIELIQEGRITTPGQLRSWIDAAAFLPPRLREHVFNRIEPSIGPNGISHLRGLLPFPPTQETGVTG